MLRVKEQTQFLIILILNFPLMGFEVLSIDENRDLLRRSLFSWTLGFGLVRLYQLEFGLWHRKSHISFFVKIQTIRLEKTKKKTGLVCKFGLV